MKHYICVTYVTGSKIGLASKTSASPNNPSSLRFFPPSLLRGPPFSSPQPRIAKIGLITGLAPDYE